MSLIFWGIKIKILKMKRIELYDEKLKQEILALPSINKNSASDDMIFIPESDCGFAEIYKIHDVLLVFLIPQFGGNPSFYKRYNIHSIEDLIQDLKSMT
jgi:hypothetical protein